jgi:hypothetical protein
MPAKKPAAKRAQSARPQGRRTKTRGARTKSRTASRIETIADATIDEHPMLSPLDKQLCRTFRDVSKREGDGFSMVQYANIALSACARNFASAALAGQAEDEAAHLRKLKHAAALYFREMLADAGGGPDVLFPFESIGRIFS